MRSQVVLQIRLRVVQRHSVVFQECVHLESSFETEESPHLPFRQRSGTITFDSERFECLPREIGPAPLESGRNIIGQIERELHDSSF